MKKLVVAVLAFVGLFALLGVVALAGLGVLSALARERAPAQMVLELDFEQGLVESVPDDPLAQLMMRDVLSLRDAVDAIDRAAGDRRVKALVARIGAGGMSLAQLQEVRDAVGRFRGAGKPTYVFSETFGEFGPGNGGYYLATAFDHIYLQPSGDVGLSGLIYESPFVRGLLDKLGVTPRMGQREQYKNSMNFYTDRTFNEAFRASMQSLMDSHFSQLVRGIAEGRGLSEEEVVALFDRGPFLGAEAVDAGLVDVLAYRDELHEELSDVAGARAEFVDPRRYLVANRPHRRGTTVAIIEGSGTVVRGASQYSALDGSVTMGSDTIGEALRHAIDDRRVKAIVFRVDSPGGSYVASDVIWRETVRAREAGKPLIVSMGTLAASGGYFVSMDADKIVAQPGTITASIGVYGGKLLTRPFWEKLGVTWDDVASSAHARMWTGTYDYGEAQERFDAGLDRIYEDFTGRVAAGRGLPVERVREELAGGRIWTGEQALELGLVDRLGGLDVALDLAREAIGLEPGAPVRLKRFPRRRSSLELLFSGRNESAEVEASVAALRMVQPALRMLRRLGVVEEPAGPLLLRDPVP